MVRLGQEGAQLVPQRLREEAQMLVESGALLIAAAEATTAG
jgi:hypothetical protein